MSSANYVLGERSVVPILLVGPVSGRPGQIYHLLYANGIWDGSL